MQINTLNKLPLQTKDSINEVFLNFCIAHLGAGDPSTYIRKEINSSIGAKQKFCKFLQPLKHNEVCKAVDTFLSTI